uniref:Secreted protein n=1 Tax=Triticum urartu TaxID=4572 RepID=A0A8R7PMZ5_TRIUA
MWPLSSVLICPLRCFCLGGNTTSCLSYRNLLYIQSYVRSACMLEKEILPLFGFQNKRLGIPKEVIPLVASIIPSCRDNDPSKQPSFYQLLSSLKKLQWLHCYRKPMTICECCL